MFWAICCFVFSAIYDKLLPLLIFCKIPFLSGGRPLMSCGSMFNALNIVLLIKLSSKKFLSKPDGIKPFSFL